MTGIAGNLNSLLLEGVIISTPNWEENKVFVMRSTRFPNTSMVDDFVISLNDETILSKGFVPAVGLGVRVHAKLYGKRTLSHGVYVINYTIEPITVDPNSRLNQGGSHG